MEYLDVGINYWAVLVAAVISMVLGALWYSPVLFGKKWMHFMGMNMEEMGKHSKEATKGYVIGFIASLVTAYVLAYLMAFYGAENFMEGAVFGFMVWLGFYAMPMAGMVLWERRPLGLYLINVGYHLVYLLIAGGVLAAWVI